MRQLARQPRPRKKEAPLPPPVQVVALHCHRCEPRRSFSFALPPPPALKTGCFHLLLKLLSSFVQSPKANLTSIIIRSLSSFAMGHYNTCEIFKGALHLRSLFEFAFQSGGDVQCAVELCWLLSFLTAKSDSILEQVDGQILQYLTNFIKASRGNLENIVGCLRTLGNLGAAGVGREALGNDAELWVSGVAHHLRCPVISFLILSQRRFHFRFNFRSRIRTSQIPRTPSFCRRANHPILSLFRTASFHSFKAPFLTKPSGFAPT